jgi:glucose-1-phosphatase
MIKTIIFDFGKVIAHFDHRLVSRRLSAHTHIPEPEVFAYLFGGRLEDDYESGRLGTQQVVDLAHDKLCLRCTKEELARLYADMFWPNEGVCALVPRLAGRYRLLLLSNTNDLHARQFRPQFRDTLAHFDAVVCSHEVGHRKPARAVFEHCQRLARCAPDECVFIDDLPANVEGARAFGWQGIVYQNDAQLRRDLQALGVRLD